MGTLPHLWGGCGRERLKRMSKMSFCVKVKPLPLAPCPLHVALCEERVCVLFVVAFEYWKTVMSAGEEHHRTARDSVWAVLGEEPEVGEGRVQGGPGRKKGEKTRGKMG